MLKLLLVLSPLALEATIIQGFNYTAVRTLAKSEDGAPDWPDVMAPGWPTQWMSKISAWETHARTCPDACNMTGMFNYDLPNNRMNQRYHVWHTKHPRITQDIDLYWFADPQKGGVSTPPNAGTGAKTNHFYATLTVPIKGKICSYYPFPGMSVPQPDMMLRANGTYHGRWKQGPTGGAQQWTDLFEYVLNDTDWRPNGCYGTFQVWYDIYHHNALADAGPTCNGKSDNEGVTYYVSTNATKPPDSLFMDYDFSKCTQAPGLFEVDHKLFGEYSDLVEEAIERGTRWMRLKMHLEKYKYQN